MANLLFVYETEVTCRKRLTLEEFDSSRALEISSYLAQSTDLALEFGDIEAACREHGIAFHPVQLDSFSGALSSFDPASTLVWTLTDGSTYFRGSAAPALARLGGFRTIGSDDSLFSLCQDKFRTGSVLQAFGLPSPAAGLARNGRWIATPPASPAGWFVKPNRLGAKIGIWEDSRCNDLAHTLELSRRVHDAYRDDVIVQPYVAGCNVRASFLAVTPTAGIEALGIFFVDSGSDFQTMADSLALYGETGAAVKASGTYQEPNLIPVSSSRPAADRKIRSIAARLMKCLGLRDVFSIDLRVEEDDTVHLIEFEVCPGLPCFDFRVYCRSQWGLSLAEAIAEAAAAKLK